LLDALTGEVAIAKVAETAPPGTVTLAGTLATAGLLLAKVIVRPPVGAFPDSLTVPAAEAPPFTSPGLTDS